MNYQEVLDMLDEMEKQVLHSIPFIEGFVTKSFVLQDVIGSAKEKVKTKQKEEQERLENLLKQAQEEAEKADPIPTRTYTKLEDLEIGDKETDTKEAYA